MHCVGILDEKYSRLAKHHDLIHSVQKKTEDFYIVPSN